MNEGSSVAVFIVNKNHQHPPQELTRDDREFGDVLLAEPFIPGKELICAVMGDRALGVIEIVPTARFYDYEAKYAPGDPKHLLPAPIPPGVYEEVRSLSLAAHAGLTFPDLVATRPPSSRNQRRAARFFFRRGSVKGNPEEERRP